MKLIVYDISRTLGLIEEMEEGGRGAEKLEEKVSKVLLFLFFAYAATATIKCRNLIV